MIKEAVLLKKIEELHFTTDWYDRVIPRYEGESWVPVLSELERAVLSGELSTEKANGQD